MEYLKNFWHWARISGYIVPPWVVLNLMDMAYMIWLVTWKSGVLKEVFCAEVLGSILHTACVWLTAMVSVRWLPATTDFAVC